MTLTKAEVNERFYNTLAGDSLLHTEGKGYLYPYAVAKLIAAQARGSGRSELKLLELGANDCAFAMSVLKLLAAFVAQGELKLDRIDYFAVDYARDALAKFFVESGIRKDFQSETAGAEGSPLVGSLGRLGIPAVNLFLVHSDAQKFVSGGSGGFDVVIMNELLADQPTRPFVVDAEGGKRELITVAHEEGEDWRVTVTADVTSEPGLADMPAETLATLSVESVAIVTRAAALLSSGGVLLIHDHGFAEQYAPIANFTGVWLSPPDFIDVEFPDEDDGDFFPRGFFRILGDEERGAMMIANDVGFFELTEQLAPLGTVVVLPHGRELLMSRSPEMDDLRESDGIFLSEFALLDANVDLKAKLERLGATQDEIRGRYATEFLDGSTSGFTDLLFIKG